jgi:hypothetical protein
MRYSKRHGKRWSTPEILTLQREFELLNLSVEEIAERHQRSSDSILFKLQSEGIFPLAKLNNNIQLHLESDDDSSSDYEDEDDIDDESDTDEVADKCSDTNTHSSMPSLITASNYDDYKYPNSDCVECSIGKLSDRVWNIETSIGEISTMVKQIFENISSEKKNKNLAPLGEYLNSKI